MRSLRIWTRALLRALTTSALLAGSATRAQKSTITGNPAIQAAADSGGTFIQLGDGFYQYKFALGGE